MYQNKGFTMVEMLFVISIIISLSLLSFPYLKNNNRYTNVESLKNQILVVINQAKGQAINLRKKTELNISSQELYFIYKNQKCGIVLPTGYSFSNIKEVYFNENGNINQANHIDFNTPHKKYTLVFHLGAGDYEFK